MTIFVVRGIVFMRYNDTSVVFRNDIMMQITHSYFFTDMMRSNEIFDLSCHIYFEEY